MPARSVDSGDPIVQRLRELVRESPELKDAAHVYEAILPFLHNADLRVGTVALTSAQARDKLEKGQPLLSGLELDLDVEAVRELMIELAAAVETATKMHRPQRIRLPWMVSSREPVSDASRIGLALEENRLDTGALLPSVAAGDNGPVRSLAKDLKLDPGLLLTLAQNALKPALREWCRQLTPLASGVPWNKGVCFVCGAAPTLAELQGNDQAKHLRCGSCGADWQSPRVQCVHCGNEDHTTLRYLYDERNREKTRIEVCDRCRGYLKVISSFAPTPADMLAIEDLATLPLDYIAEERGYVRQAVRQPV
jgi:FdhE protein